MSVPYTSMIADQYARDGFVGGVQILSLAEAVEHRRALERAEGELGPLHYIDKVHTVVSSAWELARQPAVLDVVSALIGPDVLLYNTTYIIKEPGTAAHVAWHQDLTYWGLADDDAQVSMWLALAPATEESGCMRMVPGSHRRGAIAHQTNGDCDNVLGLGQHIASLDTTASRLCPLGPGEASFHHGWTVHSSAPNISSDRRIGLNVQYVAPHNRLLNSAAGAILVRGDDRFGHFDQEAPPAAQIDASAIERWRLADEQMKANFKLP